MTARPKLQRMGYKMQVAGPSWQKEREGRRFGLGWRPWGGGRRVINEGTYFGLCATESRYNPHAPAMAAMAIRMAITS